MRKVIVSIIILLVIAGIGFGWYYLYGPCGINPVKEAGSQLVDKMDEFNDAAEVASSTPRISLSGPIADLQDIRRETSDIEVPVCMDISKKLTIKGMQNNIDGFVAFLSEESDSVVSDYMNTGMLQLYDAQTEIETVLECAPFCKTDPYKRVP